MRHLLVLLTVLFSPLVWAGVDGAVDCGHKASAKLVSLQGKLYFSGSSQGDWQEAQLNHTLCEGSRIRVEAYSRASLLLPDGIVLRLDQGTFLSLNDIAPENPTLLDLFKGFVHFISRTPKHLQIHTPIANAGPEGTEFALRADANTTALWVYEGGVKFFNTYGSLYLKPGDSALAELGHAPRSQIDLHPLDAVNWALYYPPILPYPAKDSLIDSQVRSAIEDFRHGRVEQALSSLDKLNPEKHSAFFYKIRAAMLLSVGQTDQAKQAIQAIQAIAANDAEAFALQAILALTQNHKDQAFQLAQKAVAANPQSASAYSALSYAEQSRFNLAPALAAAQQAVKLAPHDAMAWARQAELELTQGETSDSKHSAQRALNLDATLERTQTVTGFAYLSSMDTDEALQAFSTAITLDSSSPLARLGLGLAKIRNGNLTQGRQDLEIAAILDPNNALIRSYLGKAYYEEKRNRLAADQLGLAKLRDPKDPTPWFYDAIKKQTENKPVEALWDLQKAMELNDNRAVYRSKQLLDNDLAIRNTSLARIYDDLSFDSRATVEATKSLATDPANYSAHRFLSDTYVRLPRREIAQVSELLQSQLLQPLNSNPVQPHLSVKGLSAISGLGATEPSFKDFTSAFLRNKHQLTTSGIVGSNATYGDEAVLSGLHDKISYSLGQYHFSTDGFRTGANVAHNIYNAFLQTELTSDINLQFEFIKRQTDQGNIRMLLSNKKPDLEKRELDQSTGRVGLKISLSPQSQILGSFIYNDRKDKVNIPDQKTIDYRKNFETEIQYLYDGQKNDVIIGARTYMVDTKINTNTTISAPTIFTNKFLCDAFGLPFINGRCIKFPKPVLSNINTDTKSYSFYNYNNVIFPKNVNWTIGFSYELFKGVNNSAETDYHQRLFPKLGLQWFVTEWLRVRGAYIETIKRQLIADQTIEPTQVAGFNQFFDDLNGNLSTLKGIGLDANWGSTVFAGVELTERNIHSGSYKALERQARAYLNLTLSPSWAFGIEDQFEIYTLTNKKLETNLLPLTLKYFDDSGIFTQVSATLVSQKEYTSNINTDFSVVDLSIGYRLPKRLGLVSLEARNITDKHFIFDDGNDRTSDKYNVIHPFLPSRTIMFRAIFNF